MKNLRITTFLVAMTLMTAACAGGTDSTGATAATASTGTPATTTSAGDEPASTTPPEAIETVVAAVSGAYPIVDTGQDACYTDGTAAIVCPEDGDDFFGQDGNYQGSLPTHTDNGDGTVTDVITGLMWQQDPGDKMTYDAAVSGASSFDLAGYDDWRLPTIKELYSLIDFSGTDPSGCQTADCAARPFIDTDAFAFEYGDTDSGERQIDSQWATSTIYVGTTMNGDETMFGVNFADGRIKGYGLTNPGTGADKEFFVIYVRGNTAYGDNVFVDMGDGTVADLATGLMWQQADSGVGMEWEESLDYCEGLGTGGYDDWALPDVKKLQSIVDYTRSPSTTDSAAIDPVFSASTFVIESGEAGYGSYWSGTTHASLAGGANAAYVSFGEALGWFQDPRTGETDLLDVHGAGAQRSDPKTGDAADYPLGHGPQGDVIRIDNLVRCVRDDTSIVSTGGDVPERAGTTTEDPTAPGETTIMGGPLADAAVQLGVTEASLAAALGDPSNGPPDLAAAAAILGVTVEDLQAAVGPPPDA